MASGFAFEAGTRIGTLLVRASAVTWTHVTQTLANSMHVDNSAMHEVSMAPRAKATAFGRTQMNGQTVSYESASKMSDNPLKHIRAPSQASLRSRGVQIARSKRLQNSCQYHCVCRPLPR